MRALPLPLLMLLLLPPSLATAGGTLRAQQPAAPAPPQRFEKVLWVSDAVEGPQRAARDGYTAVQLGRGGDPAPLRELGLGFYLDQPIGKGVLELRDDEWRPVAQAFERTREPDVLVRPGCFAVPDRVTDAAIAAGKEVRRVGLDGLLFVALADEASSTRHNAPLDTCQCEHCLRAFREHCRQRYGGIDALNGAFGTHFVSFDDVRPVGTDPVRRRELGDRLLPADLRAYAAWLDFVDRQFADAVERIADAAQRAAPRVPVGLTGLAVPGAFGGHDYGRLLPFQTLIEPYDIGGAVELARCIAAPGAHRYATLAPPDDDARGDVPLRPLLRAHVAAMACRGLTGCVVWNDATVFDAEGRTSFGDAVHDAFDRFGAVLDACAGAKVEAGDVWVVESQASVRAWWMLDSAQDGMTWVRRLESYERTHSTSQAARRGWIRLLQDLGHQPYFVIDRELPERLLNERPRCVVLPATIAVDDRAAQALLAYASGGGVVIADHSTGLYDGELRRREHGALDRLFGVAGRSLAWQDLLVREGRSTAREPGLPPAEHGLRGALGVQQQGTDTFLERSVGRGHAYYLNAPVAAYVDWRLDPGDVAAARELRRRVGGALQRARVEPPCVVRGEGLPTCIERVPLRLRDGRRVVAVRVNALERPALLQRIARQGPVEVEVLWPRERRLRELSVGGAEVVEHGATRSCKARLDAFGALWFEVLP